MAYSEELAARARLLLASRTKFSEQKMFGGLTSMVGGHMCCGIVGEELMVRVGPESYKDALRQPHAREMDFTGKALKGMVYVGAEGLEKEEDLADWIARALAFVQTLPPK